MRLASLVLLLTSFVMAGDNWPQFRGPSGTGAVFTGRFPLEWDKDKNIAWKVNLPGVGWSSPVVVGDRVYITTAITDKQPKAKGMSEGVRDLRSMMPWGVKAPNVEYRWEVHCLDRLTGKTLWKRECAKQKPTIPVHPSNTYATETPAADEERVYSLLGPIGVVCCHDRTGKELWRKDLGAGAMTAGFGTGSSLALGDGRLFVQRDNENKSFVLALDAKTGKELWKVDRKSKSSWSTPLLWQNKLRTELIVCGTGSVVSHDPTTGKELWRMTGIPATFTSSPTADEDRLYFGTSSPTTTETLYAINSGAQGDITLKKDETSNKYVAWMVKRAGGPGMQSPVAHQGRIYLASNSFLTCIDAKTGERVFRGRLSQARMGASSLIVAQDKLLLLDEDGQMLILGTGTKFEIVARNRVEGLFWSTPAVAGDSLLLRGADRLYCIRK